MKKTLRRYVLALFVCVFAVVFGLGIMTACGDTVTDGGGETPGDGTVDEKKSFTLTLALDGGSLDKTEYSVEEGSGLLAFLQDKVPTKDGYLFGKWTLGGADVTADTKMPAADTTLTAVWKSSVTVTVYTLDFEHYDVYDDSTTTVYAYAGETLEAADYVPEHYELNEELTETLSVTVPETADATLSVYADPLYTRYTDVFESTDYLYTLEAEEGVLYLDRIGMEEGRKKSTSYDPATGAFTFKTGEADDAFVLEGAIAGEKFYYYRDTINRTFADYLDTGATLTIESKDSVTYTPADGTPQTGSYTVDAERGVYVFTPAQGGGAQREFILIQVGGILYFRMHDGLSGWYAYDGEFEGGGWSILGFDGFGVATSVEDDGVSVQFDYFYQENGTIDVIDLGLIKLKDGAHEDLGGYKISGTFSQSDGYEGEYIYVNGRRIDVLTLDGFGGAVHTYHTVDDPAASPISDGTYTVERDDTWTIRSGGQVGDYGGVNEYINYTAVNKEDGATDPVFSKGNGSGKVVLSESADDEGNTVNNFTAYYVNDDGSISFGAGDLDVLPGIHAVTGDHFVYLGTTYPLDDTHKAFLYFYNHTYNGTEYQEVDLWYGTYNTTLKEDVYELIVWAGWYAYGNEIYDPSEENGYDGMYFEDMTEDGTFAFSEETWDGETEDFVFYSGEDGKLIIDVFGDAYWVPAGSDPVAVDYEVVAQGLIFVFEFNFTGANVPATVSTLWALYDNHYDVTAYEETYTYYDLTAESSKVYQYVTYADPYDGDIASIVIVNDVTFIGFWFEYTDGSVAIEYIYAGTSTAVQDSATEFTFAWNDKIYYDDLDLLEYYYDVADFHNFQYKVDGDEFACGDGVKLTLNRGSDTLTTDGYGTATLTVGGTATKGTYELDYDLVLFFVPENGDPDADSRYFCIDTEKNTFAEIDFDTIEGALYGYYFPAILDETGSPEDFNLTDMLFLDGGNRFVYEVYDYYEDTYDVSEGTYAVSENNDGTGDYLTIALTFGADDVREARLYSVKYGSYLIGLYAIRNDALLGEYTAYDDNGEELGTLYGGEGYIEEEGLFTGEDEDGSFAYDGYMARGFIDDEDYSVTPQFTADKNGNVIVFVRWDEEDYPYQYVFDIDEEDPSKVVWRSYFYGAVGEYKVQGGQTGRYLYLDGHSSATLYSDTGTELMSGTYEYVETMENTYAFKSGGKVQFLFKPTSMEFGGAIISVYFQYFEEEDLLYVNDDWSILRMDGFGKATYIDKYGVAYSGEYYKVIEGESVYCLKVTNSSNRLFFELDGKGGFSELSGEFLIREGVLYTYFGTAEEITIPAGVTRIAKGAFALAGSTNVKRINFNEVTTIDAEAFYHATSITEIVSDKILTVGANAFEGVMTLQRVELLNCTAIGDNAFLDCAQLTEVKLGKIESIGAFAFKRSVAVYQTPFTLDLTAMTVEALGKLKIDLTAFLASRGWMNTTNETIMGALMEDDGGDLVPVGGKVLVSGGIEALNAARALLSGETGSIEYYDRTAANALKTGKVKVDLTPYLALAAAEEDPADGLAFYDLKTDAVLIFDGGVATVYAKGSYYYDVNKSYSYYVEEGKVVLFSKDTSGAFKKDFTVDVSGTTLTLENVNYAKSETTTEWTLTINEKSLTLKYLAKVDASSSLRVTVTITGITYDGKEATSFNSTPTYDNTVTFNADNHSYKLTLAGDESTVEDLGEEIVLTDKSQAVWFRVTLTGSGTEYTLKKIEYNSSGATSPDAFYEAYSGLDYTVTGDLTYSIVQNYACYTVKVVVADSAPSLSVVNEGYKVQDSGYDYKILLKVSDDKTQILEVKGIEDSSGEGVYTVISVQYSEDKKTATATTNNGTFVITIDLYEYNSVGFELTVIHADYDYTETLYDEDYNYEVTIKFHVDGEGNAKATGVEKFVDYNTKEEMTFVSATVDAEGVITVNFTDGKVAKVTVNFGYWTDLTIEWVEQA